CVHYEFRLGIVNRHCLWYTNYWRSTIIICRSRQIIITKYTFSKNNMSQIIHSVVSVVIILDTLLSCGGTKRASDTLRVGIQAGPEYRLAEEAKKVAKEKYNLEVELVTFNDYVMPNEALHQGDIDIDVFQTTPYLEDQMASRGYKLAIVGNTFV